MTLAQAQATVVATAQQKAANSSFYSAMRLMPKAEREAMFAIYGFCRIVDDIADDGIGTREERKVELVKWRVELDELYAGNPSERAQFLVEPVGKYGLRKADFLTVIDGMDMDVAEDIVAPAKKTLDLYCERVASAVGRLSIKVFGMDEGPGDELAHHLGRALQLTNILRDIDEDAAIGRLYLPREMLFHAGITSPEPQAVITNPALPKACAPLVMRARAHFEKSDDIMGRNARRVVRAPRIMSKYYRKILELLVARGFALPRHPVRLGKAAKIAILLQYAIV